MADVEASTTAPTQNMVTSNEATATPEPELALTAAGVDEATALAEVSAQSTRPAQIEATANATATATADASTPSATKRQTDEAPKPALSTEPPTKRARTGQDAEGRNRQRRLFGVLTKTLTKFQEDTKKESEASKRRAAVEERLAAKLREEHEKLEAATGKERARRNLRFEIIKKEDERNAFVAIYRSRRAAKTNLANFLCTTNKHTEAAASAQTLGNLRPAPLPEVPHAFAPSVSASASASSARPLYYLPYKLLPWQADKIDAQVEDMRIELDKEEEAWREELQKRDEEIKELKSKAQEVNAEMARESGEGSRRSRDRRADSAAMDEDLDAQPSLPARAPLPEREGRVDEDTSEQTRVASDGDATMKSTADGEDVLEY